MQSVDRLGLVIESWLVLTVTRGGTGGRSVPAEGTFSGSVWADVHMSAPQDGIAVGEVFFEPCARTNWHSHPGGQLLIITAGDGFVGNENETIAVRPGDAVWTPPNERHWHGASPGRFLLHTAVTLGVTAWEGPLNDAEYASATETAVV